MKLKLLYIDLKANYSDIPEHWLKYWLLFVINKPASFLITDPEYILSESELTRLESGLKKMQLGTPLAYLTGKQAFWSLDFIVNEHTLIPRPDTEILVEKVLEWIEKKSVTHQKPAKILDLGTGSGCIAISLAKELQSNYSNCWQMTAVDFSEEALRVAEENIVLNQVDNIKTVKSTWYENLATPTDEKDKFSIIVSNPPYIDNKDEHLDKLMAEPITALVADNHGLADIKQIVGGAGEFLLSGGLLAIEHGYAQGQQVRDIFLQYGFTEIQTIQDYGRNDRVTMGIATDILK